MNFGKQRELGAFAFASSAILLANSLLFNLIFKAGPLRVWKQALSVALFWFFFSLFRKTFPRVSINNYSRIRVYILSSFLILSFLSLYALVIGFSVTRIVFAVFMYIGWMPFLIFPFITNSGERSFFRLFSFLGILLGAGLLVDHFFGIFHFLSIGSAGDDWMESKDFSAIRRASFLFESPTAISYYLNFCLLSLIYVTLNRFAGRSMKALCAFGVVLLLAGATFTASRQVIATASFMTVFGGLSFFVSTNKGKSSFVGLFLIAAIVLTGGLLVSRLIASSEQGENISQRFVDVDEGIFQRRDLWAEGLSLFSFDNAARWIQGRGIGSCMGNHAKPTETVHHHYESSFFMTFHEGGLLLLFVVYWPSVVSFKILFNKQNCHLRSLLLIFIFCYWGISVIAPGVLHPTAQMCIYLTLGLTLSLKPQYAKRLPTLS